VQATQTNSLSLVRFDGNDYSVPVRSAYREVVVKGDCVRVRSYVNRKRTGFAPAPVPELLRRAYGPHLRAIFEIGRQTGLELSASIRFSESAPIWT
jgi:hypothetical protein